MSALIKVVKRKARKEMAQAKGESSGIQPGASTIVNTVKSWIEASRERRQVELELAFEFRQRYIIGEAARRRPAVVATTSSVLMALQISDLTLGRPNATNFPSIDA